MKALTEQEREQVRLEIAACVEVAHSLGLVVTVRQQPELPLAMGHYSTVVEVRDVRS